jgi:hypothetical protein
MSDRNVFDFTSPEMSAPSLRLFTRARSLSVVGLLLAFFAAAWMA